MRPNRAWSVALTAAVMVGGGAPAFAAPDTGKQCAVSIERNMAPGTFQVTREHLDDGGCVCYISTGPVTQAASVEKSIAQIQASQDCERKNFPIGALVGTGALGGAIAAVVGGGHRDSPGG
jgi:hypothetical protein